MASATTGIMYPEELVDEVKRLFPMWDELHTALDTGSAAVPVMISSVEHAVDPDRIIELLNTGRTDELRRAAGEKSAIKKLKVQLYVAASLPG